jgi:hypothetical protein
VFASEESTRRAVMYELGSGSETYPGGYGIDGMSMLSGSGGSLPGGTVMRISVLCRTALGSQQTRRTRVVGC